MSKTTKVIVAVGVVAVVLFLLTGISRASTVDVTSQTTTATPLPTSFDFKVVQLPTRSTGKHCFQIVLDQQIKNLLGKVQAWPAVDTEWCSGRYERKVTDLVYFHCFSKGGFYAFDGCKKDLGKVGYSYLSAVADWHYHWIINGLVFDKTPALDVKLYANGHAVGGWYWWTA
jgi:hypothetical protein